MNKKVIITTLLALSLTTNSLAADITYYGLNNGYSKINSVNFADVANQGDNYWAKPAIYQIASSLTSVPKQITIFLLSIIQCKRD